MLSLVSTQIQSSSWSKEERVQDERALQADVLLAANSIVINIPGDVVAYYQPQGIEGSKAGEFVSFRPSGERGIESLITVSISTDSLLSIAADSMQDGEAALPESKMSLSEGGHHFFVPPAEFTDETLFRDGYLLSYQVSNEELTDLFVCKLEIVRICTHTFVWDGFLVAYSFPGASFEDWTKIKKEVLSELRSYEVR